ncbi:transcription factor [Fusarium pseudocircinatum]|uniref:Transcription factor n=1 Tax=Fusarium pseudocircinatum TaxID=56676 RepID=A0A8H5NXE0_9HYPO|nr:transcription factor [Fusarium pseudocircinatum]
MFGTWKYDPETDEVQSVRNGFDPVTARSSSHQACDRCHEKKLKCSGDKNGCERCRSNGLRCEYTRSGSKSSKKKSSPRKSNDGDSPSSSSSRRGGSSSKRSSKHHGHSSRIVTSGDEAGGVLSQFDFSQLSPEDGFDLNLLSSADQSAGGYATAGPSGDQYSMQGYDTSYQQWDASGYSQGYSNEAWGGEYDQSAYSHDPRYYQSGR